MSFFHFFFKNHLSKATWFDISCQDSHGHGYTPEQEVVTLNEGAGMVDFNRTGGVLKW